LSKDQVVVIKFKLPHGPPVSQSHCDCHSDTASDALESCGHIVAPSFTMSQSSGTSVP